VVLESTPPLCLAVSRDADNLSRSLDAAGMLQHNQIPAIGWSSFLCPGDILLMVRGELARKQEGFGSGEKRTSDFGELEQDQLALDGMQERLVLRSRSAPGRPPLPRAPRASGGHGRDP
jgi:hypothetical protein